MLNENSDGTVLCRYGVRWARAGCCRNKSFMNNSAGMYNTRVWRELLCQRRFI